MHTYARSILFNPNPNPNPRNPRKENPDPNLKNPRKKIKSFFETNHLWNLKKTLSVALKDGGFVIERLDENNFQVWKFRIMNFLMGKGYWEN